MLLIDCERKLFQQQKWKPCQGFFCVNTLVSLWRDDGYLHEQYVQRSCKGGHGRSSRFGPARNILTAKSGGDACDQSPLLSPTLSLYGEHFLFFLFSVVWNKEERLCSEHTVGELTWAGGRPLGVCPLHLSSHSWTILLHLRKTNPSKMR